MLLFDQKNVDDISSAMLCSKSSGANTVQYSTYTALPLSVSATGQFVSFRFWHATIVEEAGISKTNYAQAFGVSEHSKM